MLISPHVLGAVNRKQKDVVVDLSKKQIEQSPSLHRDKPVSRQFEESYSAYYGLPMYWNGGPHSWGAYPYPMRDRTKWVNPTPKNDKPWDANLRSTDDVIGPHIQATDGKVGHVEDFLIDVSTWAIRYLVVDTRNWWPGKKVLVSTQRIDRVSWPEAKFFVNMSRETLKQSPEYSEKSLLSREYETNLYGHYKRPGYWLDEAMDR